MGKLQTRQFGNLLSCSSGKRDAISVRDRQVADRAQFRYRARFKSAVEHRDNLMSREVRANSKTKHENARQRAIV